MLVYVEAVLIAQYVYQIPTRLHCALVTPRTRTLVEQVGLHGNALRCIPLFAAYLATLMHTFAIARQKVPPLFCCCAHTNSFSVLAKRGRHVPHAHAHLCARAPAGGPFGLFRVRALLYQVLYQSSVPHREAIPMEPAVLQTHATRVQAQPSCETAWPHGLRVSM